MELQETQEGGLAGGGEGDGTFALAQVLEEEGDDVVQRATASSAHRVIYADQVHIKQTTTCKAIMVEPLIKWEGDSLPTKDTLLDPFPIAVVDF